LALFGLFAAFTLYFFRDPEAKVPAGKALIVSPGHGTVDTIDRVTESEIMGGSCQRISIFLSVFNVHVQQSPVAGKVTYVKHTPGQFMNALKIECAAVNENVLIGFQSAEPAGQTIAVRLITGLIARRIIPWVTVEDVVAKGERISLIQFGSRVDVYLPLHAEVAATLGQKVVGGETVIARIMQ
jgi:phosphatidylserine decarboxylase